MLGWNEHSGRLVRRLGPAAAPCTCNYSSLRLHLSKHVVNGESRWREIGGVFFIEDDDEFYYFLRNVLSWIRGESRWREIGGVFFIEDDDEFYYFFRNIYCRGFVEIEDGAKSVDFFL